MMGGRFNEVVSATPIGNNRTGVFEGVGWASQTDNHCWFPLAFDH